MTTSMTGETERLLDQAETPLDRSLILMQIEQHRATAALNESMRALADSFTAHRVEWVAHRDILTKLDVKFDAHVIEEGGLLTWGLRVFSLVCSLLVFIVGTFGWYVARHIIDVNQAQQATIDVNSNRLTALETLLKDFATQHPGK